MVGIFDLCFKETNHFCLDCTKMESSKTIVTNNWKLKHGIMNDK